VLGVRHPRVKSLGEAYDVVDLGGVPLEEEEEEAAYEVDEAVDLDRIPLEEEVEEAYEVVDLDGIPLEEEEEEACENVDLDRGEGGGGVDF